MTKIKFLCIDPGLKHAGIAVSHYGKFSEGLTTIQGLGFSQQLEKIIQIINKYNPEKIIIGLPKRGDVHKYSKQLGKAIQKDMETPVIYVNEDKTSARAKDEIINSKKNSKKIHQISAAVILQNFIDDLIQ